MHTLALGLALHLLLSANTAQAPVAPDVEEPSIFGGLERATAGWPIRASLSRSVPMGMC